MLRNQTKKNQPQQARPIMTEREWGEFTARLRNKLEPYFREHELSIIDQFIQTASGEVEPMQIEQRRAADSFCETGQR